jgi:polysaccharide biosynthesis/export protein
MRPESRAGGRGAKRCGGMARSIGIWGAALALSALSACTTVPASGPTASELIDSADKQNDLGFKIVDLTPALAGLVSTAPTETLESLVAPGAPLPAVDRIGVGDVLDIRIFEAGPGLFPPAREQSQEPGQRTTPVETTLAHITVDDKGEIALPYDGAVVAAGLTTAALQARLVAGLRNKALEPQVMVTVAQNVANTVVLSGDVKFPGRRPVTLAHETVLDMIADAGGSLHPPQDTVVRLTRGGQQRSVRLSAILAASRENIVLAPGDRIELLYEPRTYTAFGAAGKPTEVPFESGNLSLADAIARAGGPIDSAGDPSGIFLFRYEDPKAAAALGLPAGQPDPVVYHIDLRNAESYFTIQQFAMRDKDVIFVASAKTDALQKLFNLIGSLLSPAAVGRTVAP